MLPCSPRRGGSNRFVALFLICLTAFSCVSVYMTPSLLNKNSFVLQQAEQGYGLPRTIVLLKRSDTLEQSTLPQSTANRFGKFNNFSFPTMEEGMQASALKNNRSNIQQNKNTKNEKVNKTSHTRIDSQVVTRRYHLRDISNYSGTNFTNSLPKTTLHAKCRPFKCTKDEFSCDNMLPTNYDGPDPPCCTHILRDLAHIFDEMMSTLGLDYVVSFGTLLGLARSDKIIPWTGDNDIIIKDPKTAHAMVDLWKSTYAASKSGLALMFQGILRLCITPQFAEGKIQKWLDERRKNCRGWLYSCEVPYVDFYVGHNISDDEYGEIYREIGNCKHFYQDIFPSQRRAVYNGTFSVNFPANPEQLLRSYYGTKWAMPPEEKMAHGLGWKKGECPFGPSY